MGKIDVVVIGAGPAGMMAAACAALRGLRVVCVDKNDVPGRKLRITGKGRCNVTNRCERDVFFDNIIDNPRFLYGAYAAFSCDDTVSFFESLGVPLKTERGNRVFPQSDKASDIADALADYARDAGVRFCVGQAVKILTEEKTVKGVRLKNGETLDARAVIYAAGGASYPLTGSDGKSFSIVRELGHTITPLKPALVPLTVQESDLCEQMQGLSLKNVRLTLCDENGKKKFSDFGEMLFTHFGVSGPLVLSASCYAAPGDRLSIDLKPALDRETLDKRLISDFARYANKNFSNALDDLLPAKMVPVVVSLSDISAEKKPHDITRAERENLLRLLKDFSLTVTGTRPLAEAIITSGGVCVKEVAKDMQSKLIKGLYFAGEALDVCAYTGGFNLQIAFSTGYLAGTSCLL